VTSWWSRGREQPPPTPTDCSARRTVGLVENAEQSSDNATKRRVPGRPFKPGNPGGPGRKRKTAEARELERLTRAQVQQRLEEMVGPALKRLLAIVEQGGDSDAYKTACTVLDRTVGPVPSYVAASINSGSDPVRQPDAQALAAAAKAYLLRQGALQAIDATPAEPCSS
jgi:hypothetical protein